MARRLRSSERLGSSEEPALPRHVAIIMDGNGRWAERQGLSRSAGHEAGIEPVRNTVETCAEYGIDTLTLFAFSSENWQRPAEEVSCLMALLLDAIKREIDELDRNGVRVRFIGDRALLGADLERATREAEAQTAKNTGLRLVIAVAYGGRWDLANAARQLAGAVKAGALDPNDIDETRLAQALSTAELPPVDLLIRTGGEQRISNFLLWDVAYSEIFFSDRLWPEFDRASLDEALAFFASRQRRFGLTAEQSA
ncbi:MAG: polyprenyl diphosphate synthase [Gammaproteobacteria bacterium]|nr:polyprenyl diphosphate synthase [Gammaproteobacteria bacterium]